VRHSEAGTDWSRLLIHVRDPRSTNQQEDSKSSTHSTDAGCARPRVPVNPASAFQVPPFTVMPRPLRALHQPRPRSRSLHAHPRLVSRRREEEARLPRQHRGADPTTFRG
jgi:hypothetical protein